MPQSLVIVESSAKSKTIQKYLNQNGNLKSNGPYKVVASLGHIVDLPPKELGVNTDTWELSYETIRTKCKVIKQLKEEIQKSKEIYLATDPDREGEAIAWHLKNLLGLKCPKRVLFHEITPKALETAMTNPKVIDEDMVEAQESRRALDRIVGFKVSPLLWHRFTSPGLSAGRVQSVVLRNVVEKFQNYEKHVPESFWTMEGTFEVNKTSLEGDLVSKGTTKKMTFDEPSTSLQMLEAIQKQTSPSNWSISYELKTSHKSPSAPFTTSALQQEAYETFKIPAKSTMQLAQKLYEEGHITYMRTDSVNISKDARDMIQQYIIENYTESSYENRVFKSKVANAQEAHECIRPTHISKKSTDLDDSMTPSHRKIYDLIWRRTVASQMVAATYVDVIYRIQSKLPIFKDYEFYGKVSLLQDQGYLKVWAPKQKPDTEEIEQWKKKLGDKTPAKVYDTKIMSKGNITKPEGLYNESAIVKWMEREGIGRPSTYATIVDKLFDKGYVTKGANPLKTETVEHYVLENKEISTQEETLSFGGNEKDRFIPTSLGEGVYTYLIERLPKILNYKFTSQLEESLDEISRKEKTKKEVLSSFYQELEPIVEKEQQAMKEYRAAHKKEKKEKKPLAPKASNIIKEFPSETMQLIQTRYGPALFHTENKKFISVQPFLQWKAKDIEQLETADVRFLKKFPISLNDSTVIEYGRYGLYLVHNKKNIRLPKEAWESIYKGSYKTEDLLKYVTSK